MTGKGVSYYCPLLSAEHWFYWAAPSCDCVHLFACRVHIFTKWPPRISHAEMCGRCCCTITVTQLLQLQLLYSKSQQVLQQMTSSARPGKIQRLIAPHTNSHHLPLYCILCLQKASHNLKWQAPVSTFPPSLLIPPHPHSLCFITFFSFLPWIHAGMLLKNYICDHLGRFSFRLYSYKYFCCQAESTDQQHFRFTGANADESWWCTPRPFPALWNFEHHGNFLSGVYSAWRYHYAALDGFLIK